jgi:hypothetical protein
MSKQVTRLTGSEVSQAKNKARYGGKNWLFWVNKRGEKIAAVATASTVKEMMLDCGTKGHMVMYDRDGGMILNWWIANNIRRQLIAGY